MRMTELNILSEMVVTEIPASKMAEIHKNIKKGAKDLTVAWANAIILVNWAFKQAIVELPTPDIEKPWAQYETCIEYAVNALSQERGIDGSWRTSYSLVDECQYDVQLMHRNVFTNYRMAAANIEAIVEQIKNTLPEYDIDVSSPAKNITEMHVSKFGVEMKTKVRIRKL